jgi:hypothetical protein
VLFFFRAGTAEARDLGISFQSGVINGSYTGADAGETGMASTMDAGAELIVASRYSLYAHSSMSLDPDTAIIRYLYAGVGRRIYFFSHAASLSFVVDHNKVELNPKTQYFVSVEAGVSQTVVKQVTPSLSIQSTSIEYGGGIGMVYPINKTVGLTLTLGLGKGVGISAVAVDSTVTKAMFGLVMRGL